MIVRMDGGLYADDRAHRLVMLKTDGEGKGFPRFKYS